MMSNKTVNAIVQARMGSTRLPGKVLMLIEGKPILEHIVNRLQEIKEIANVVVATSTEIGDNPIESWCLLKGIPCVRGSEANVLDRFFQASLQYPADVFIRATGDNPMIDIQLIRDMLKFFDCNSLTYTCYRNYPLGSGVEIFTNAALEQARKYADKPYELEHVTPYMYERMANRNVKYYISNVNDSDIRMTIDTKEDLLFAIEIFSRLYMNNPFFGVLDVKRLVSQEPDMKTINNGIHQKKLGE